MFVWEQGSLNDEQIEAIKYDKSVLLVACPGSGKTRTLTYKIAYELSRLTSSKEYVIAITFTNSAADEIKERVELLGVDTTQLWIGTIHAFCMEWILKPYHLYHNKLKNGFTIINSFESEELLTELCEPYKDRKITFYDCGIIAKPDNIYLTSLDPAKQPMLQKILGQYFEILENKHQVDFEQILYYSWQLLQEKTQISQILCKLFPFILIDEYQDTKEIQYHIIAKILRANEGKSMTFIVGDPNQSIYETLGGFPMEQNKLEDLLGFELLPLNLSKNYRSSEGIIEYFEHYKTFPNEIIATGVVKDYQSIITYKTDIHLDNLIEELARLILYNISQKGISPNEICIVAPQWIHIASITRKLMIKLPDLSFDGPGMAPFSRDIENFWYKVSRIVLTEPSPFIYVRRLRWSHEILNDFEAAGVSMSMSNKEFLKICNSIQIHDDNGLQYLRNFFLAICERIKINIENYPLLQQHYTSFFESSEKRIKKLKDEGNETIDELENFKKVFRQRDGITVSTIHGTKGAEYDTVIGFALLNDFLPHFNDSNGYQNSKKLLYVLASRARKNLHLLSETHRSINKKHAPAGKGPTPILLNYKFNYTIF